MGSPSSRHSNSASRILDFESLENFEVAAEPRHFWPLRTTDTVLCISASGRHAFAAVPRLSSSQGDPDTFRWSWKDDYDMRSFGCGPQIRSQGEASPKQLESGCDSGSGSSRVVDGRSVYDVYVCARAWEKVHTASGIPGRADVRRIRALKPTQREMFGAMVQDREVVHGQTESQSDPIRFCNALLRKAQQAHKETQTGLPLRGGSGISFWSTSGSVAAKDTAC